MALDRSKRVRALASSAVALLALSGCYTLQDQVNVGLELPDAVRQNTKFIVASGSVSETNEWAFLAQLAGMVAAGIASGSATFGVESASYLEPTDYKLAAKSPHAAVKSINLATVLEDTLKRAMPSAVVDKSQSPPPSRVELTPAIVLRTENAKDLYVLCTIVSTQYVDGNVTWSRPYIVEGGSGPILKAAQPLSAEEFRGYATQCLGDAMRGYRKHISGELRDAYLSGKTVPGTMQFTPDRGQRGLFVLDADEKYAYYFGARTGSIGRSVGSVTTVPLQYVHKFERQ